MTEREFDIWIDSIELGSIDELKKYFVTEFLERPKNGKLAIHYACIHGRLEITQQLIHWNCNIEALDKEKWRPMHHACRENRVKIVKLLIENNCEIDPINTDKWTPLHYASGYGHSEVVQILIDNNSDIEAITGDGWTPFHNACRFGHLENVKILLNNNCKIEIYDKDRCTPVHYACSKGYEDILQLLLANNCNIEACDKNNWRPIHYACANNKKEIVKLLLQHACNIDVRTADNKSPTELAMRHNNKDLIDMLDEELARTTLIKDLVASMNAECVEGCDHKLCYKSLRSKNFDKGETIGRGGHGKVFKIKSTKTKDEFAIKEIRANDIVPTNKDNSNKFDQIKKVIERYKMLKHDRIIKFYGALLMSTEKLVIFMELAVGGTIQDQIKKQKTIPIDQIIHYSRQILEGLEYLHGLNIIHRDVKPLNILLTRENNVKLADFDLCRETSFTSNITTFCGTANFCAPEIINSDNYKFPVDIWSVGATIINMITGKAPYEDLKISQAIMFKIANEKTLEMPSDELLSDDLKSFITDMLHADPLKRPNASKLLKHKFLCHS